MAAPSTSGMAPFSTSQRATSGEYQMRARVVLWSSAGSKPSRGAKPASQGLCLTGAVEPVAARGVAVDVPGVDVPVREPPLDRVWLDGPGRHLGRLGLQVLELDELVLRDRAGERGDEILLRSAVWGRRPRQLEDAECLLELCTHPRERRVRSRSDHRADELKREPDCARLERRQPRQPRKVSPKSSLSTCTSSP